MMLRDVIRESAQAALSYVRSTKEKLGIDPPKLCGESLPRIYPRKGNRAYRAEDVLAVVLMSVTNPKMGH